jgi:hypothetical protein
MHFLALTHFEYSTSGLLLLRVLINTIGKEDVFQFQLILILSDFLLQ